MVPALLASVSLGAAIWVGAQKAVVSDSVCGSLLRPSNLHSSVCDDFYRRHVVLAVVFLVIALALGIAAVLMHREADGEATRGAEA